MTNPAVVVDLEKVVRDIPTQTRRTLRYAGRIQRGVTGRHLLGIDVPVATTGRAEAVVAYLATRRWKGHDGERLWNIPSGATLDFLKYGHTAV